MTEATAAPLAENVDLALRLDQAIERVTEALVSEGFGVLTRIDVHTVMKAKLDFDFRPYTILGACNPPIARRALEIRGDVGLLLPCNIVVEEIDPGRTRVRIGKPTTLMNVGDLASDPRLGAVASEVATKLEAVARELRAEYGVRESA